MLRYSLMFLVLAVLALALGIWALTGMAALIARVLVGLFLILFIASLLRRRNQRNDPGP